MLFETFENTFNAMSMLMMQNSADHGFWKDGQTRNKAEMIALMHSELSEALEAIRHNNPPDTHCPDIGNLEIELADCVIRIMDFAHGFNLNVGKAICQKYLFNRSRPPMHGKEF